MAYKDTDIIYIMTDKESYIPPLRQIGPIPNPLPISVLIATKCIQCGCPISEYDPETGLVVKLTMENLYDDQKFIKAKAESDAIKKGEKNPSDSETGEQKEPNQPATEPDIGQGEIEFDDTDTQSDSPSSERARFLAEGFTEEEINEMGIS